MNTPLIHTYTHTSPHHSSPLCSIFILPSIVTIAFATLTFYPGTGQFLAGELSQRQSINQLFSNVTWVNLPDPSQLKELPVGSNDYQLIRQWGNPNIWVSLILFIIVRVSTPSAQQPGLYIEVVKGCQFFRNVCMFVVQYIFVAISVALPIPSGVFFPIFVIGK